MDLYIGGIPFKWKNENLVELFEPYGEILSAKIVIDKITRQNKGFGFVTLESDEAAMQAMTDLNGSEHLGRTITVTISVPKSEDDRKKERAGKRRFLSGGNKNENRNRGQNSKRPFGRNRDRHE